MKRGVQKDKPEVDDNSAPEQPEFARVKLKKAVSLASNASFENVADGPSNELMRKLKKQKSVAEALGRFSFLLNTTTPRLIGIHLKCK